MLYIFYHNTSKKRFNEKKGGGSMRSLYKASVQGQILIIITIFPEYSKKERNQELGERHVSCLTLSVV